MLVCTADILKIPKSSPPLVFFFLSTENINYPPIWLHYIILLSFETNRVYINAMSLQYISFAECVYNAMYITYIKSYRRWWIIKKSSISKARGYDHLFSKSFIHRVYRYHNIISCYRTDVYITPGTLVATMLFASNIHQNTIYIQFSIA